MKKLDLNAFNAEKISKSEMAKINGGYYEYTWSGTDNPLIYAFEAASNGCKAVANGAIWLYGCLG